MTIVKASKPAYFLRIIFFVLFVLCSNRISSSDDLKGSSDNSVVMNKSKLWSSNFGSVTSSNVPYNCDYNGKPICCNSLRDNGHNAKLDRQKNKRNNCLIKKTYIQSPYEEMQFHMAKNLSMIKDAKLRRKRLIDFITSQQQIDAANVWLEMIKNRMMNTKNVTKNDYMYLSRFRITKYCSSPTKKIFTWDEWIEPLTVHARHPFSVSGCGNEDVKDLFLKKKNYLGAVDIMNVDYILTQSAASFNNNTNSKLPIHLGQTTNKLVKKFFFDAGTSTFQSSLMWFTCAYSQVKNMLFDNF